MPKTRLIAGGDRAQWQTPLKLSKVRDREGESMRHFPAGFPWSTAYQMEGAHDTTQRRVVKDGGWFGGEVARRNGLDF